MTPVARLTLVVLTTLGAGCELITGPGSVEEANQAMEGWVSQHPTEWVVEATASSPLSLESQSLPCSQPPVSNTVRLQFAVRGVGMTIGLHCPISTNASVEQLQSALSYVAIDELPDGITLNNWDFQIWTPVSSFSKGVTFSKRADGKLQIEINTPLYAIYGGKKTKECNQNIQDAGKPEGCIAFREHRIPLLLTAVAPFDLSALK